MGDVIKFSRYKEGAGSATQPPNIANPVELLEHFLAMAKQDQLLFLGVHAYLRDGTYTRAEIGLVTDEDVPEGPEPEAS